MSTGFYFVSQIDIDLVIKEPQDFISVTLV